MPGAPISKRHAGVSVLGCAIAMVAVGGCAQAGVELGEVVVSGRVPKWRFGARVVAFWFRRNTNLKPGTLKQNTSKIEARPKNRWVGCQLIATPCNHIGQATPSFRLFALAP